MLKIGDQVPDFELPDQNNNMVRIYDLIKTENVVLFFYPKDGSPGCSKQACSFRDNFSQFKKYNAEVIGISSDPHSAHKDFADALKLPFTLLSDAEGKVRQLFGIKNTLGILPGRATFVIDKKGKIKFTLVSQFLIQQHIEESLKAVQRLNSRD